MEVSPAGRTAEFANHIEPGRVLAGTRAGTARIPALAADAGRAADGRTGGAADRARIDDLTLTLHYADTELGLTTSHDRIAALRPLARAYASGLGTPLTDAERRALPGPSPGSRFGASAAGSRCSTTRRPPGHMPGPRRTHHYG